MWCNPSTNVLIRNNGRYFGDSSEESLSDATSGQYPAVMSSTLVETVSINYEDFSEYFLTCGTCLCNYDGGEHTPKLLPCSHTVCLNCLGRIVASPSQRDEGHFRCPICRENIRIPSGGVAALPPSFIVNQLLDLMSTQRREVVPKCSVHNNQELLFCESCDLVFCLKCNSGNHHSMGASDSPSTSSSTTHHTVIPLATAVKRMSEILCYKANECYAKLNSATDAVTQELQRLDLSVETAFDEVNKSFESLSELVEQRRLEVVAAVEAIRERKNTVLQEQIQLIESERSKVKQECEGLQYQVEVRNITKKIAHLNTKIDSLAALAEPRENAFLRFEPSPQSTYSNLCGAVKEYGRVATSRTLPSLCSLSLPTSMGSKPTTHLRTKVVLSTVDYLGHSQMSGGDPVEATVKYGSTEELPCDIQDNKDGSYDILFTPVNVGTHTVTVSIFSRPIKNNPLNVDVCGDHNPHTVYGSKGGGGDQLLQPAALCLDTDTGTVFIADTGNSRIKVLDSCLSEQHHLVGEALEGRSVTGLCFTPSSHTLMLVNWRNQTITELTQQGEIVQQFTHEELKEPTSLTVTASGLIVVVDQSSAVRVFSASGGELLYSWGMKGLSEGQIQAVSALCWADTGGSSHSESLSDDGEIVLADHRLQVFSVDGKFMRTIYKPQTGAKGPKGNYGGLFLDSNGLLLASRQERTHSCVQVFDYYLGSLIFTIDSTESKLKRPAGLAATKDGWLLVLDIANCCVKKFRYR